jgi:hypothetical protein
MGWRAPDRATRPRSAEPIGLDGLEAREWTRCSQGIPVNDQKPYPCARENGLSRQQELKLRLGDLHALAEGHVSPITAGGSSCHNTCVGARDLLGRTRTSGSKKRKHAKPPVQDRFHERVSKLLKLLNVTATPSIRTMTVCRDDQ